MRAVYDEIEVTGNDTFFDDAKDAWIGTQVRSEMVLDPDIRSVNYMIETENGSVYLIGTARTPAGIAARSPISRAACAGSNASSPMSRCGRARRSVASGPGRFGPVRRWAAARCCGAAAPRTPMEIEKLQSRSDDSIHPVSARSSSIPG